MNLIYVTLSLLFANAIEGYTCPIQSVGREQHRGLKCCSTVMANRTGCFKDGPQVQSCSDSKDCIESVIMFKDDRPHGKFVSYRDEHLGVSVSGNYLWGHPDGTWNVYDSAKEPVYVLNYAHAQLASITMNNNGKLQKITPKPLVYHYNNYSRIIGQMSPPIKSTYSLTSDAHRPSGGLGPVTFLYSDSDKKDILGFADSRHIFLTHHYLESRAYLAFDSDILLWSVVEKKGPMCLVSLGDPSPNLVPIIGGWTDCLNYTDLYDLYTTSTMDMNRYEVVYSSPGGPIKFLDVGHCEKMDARMNIQILEKRMYQKNIWFKFSVKGGCRKDEGEEETTDDSKQDEAWAPFFKGKTTTINYYSRGC
jgi:hypothetical protein